ncbi:helix-turn-helix domain-containing protein [Streptomyces sp. NPDC003042]
MLEGAFALLEALRRLGDEAGVTELALACQVPKATVHRLLDQLVALGAVERRGSRCLGPASGGSTGRGIARCGASLAQASALPLPADHPALRACAVVQQIIERDHADFGVYASDPQPARTVLSDVRVLASRVLGHAMRDQLAERVPEDLVAAYEEALTRPRRHARNPESNRPEVPGFMAPPYAIDVAIGVTAALQILSQSTPQEAGEALRFLARLRSDGVPPPTPGDLARRGNGISHHLSSIRLAAIGPGLNPSSQLRYRTTTTRPRIPRSSPAQIRARARSIPSLLWAEPTLRLSPRESPRARVLRPGLSGLLLMVDSQMKPADLTDLLGGVISGRTLNYVLKVLHKDPQWPNVQALLVRLADHLDNQSAPINYGRRRHLDYTALLPERAWRDICRRCDAEPGKEDRHLSAQRRLYELLSGMPADRAPASFATISSMDRTRLALFTAALTPQQTRELDQAGSHFLSLHDIVDEPASWQPPSEIYSGLCLPGIDPTAFDTTAIHRLQRDQRALSDIAEQLAISLDAARHLLELHPIPAEATSGPWTSMHGSARRYLSELLPEGELRSLYSTMSLERIADSFGVSRHLISALADDYGVDRRTPTQRLRREIDPAWLYDQYVLHQRTFREFGGQIGMTGSALRARARSYGIPVRRKGATHVTALRITAQVADGPLPEILLPALSTPRGHELLFRFATAASYPTLQAAAQHLGINPATFNYQMRSLAKTLGGRLLETAYRDHPQRLTDLGVAVIEATAQLTSP